MNTKVIYLLIIIAVYVIGFLGTLITLYKTDGFWGMWNNYDPLHPSDYDDYESNATAYLSFSIFWPIFDAFNILVAFYSGLKKFSQYLDKKFKKDAQISGNRAGKNI